MDINSNKFSENEISFEINSNKYLLSFISKANNIIFLLMKINISFPSIYYSKDYTLKELKDFFIKSEFKNIDNDPNNLINIIKQDIYDFNNRNGVIIKVNENELNLEMIINKKIKDKAINYMIKLNKEENYNNIIINNLYSIIKKQQNQIDFLIKEINDIKKDITILKGENKIKNEIENNNINLSNNQYFKKNPNLKYKETINDTGVQNSFTTFEIYYSYQDDNELRLIYSNRNTLMIDIFRIKDNYKIVSLKENNNINLSLRHFFNYRNKSDYLISTQHETDIVKLWNLSDNFKLVYSILTQYHSNIMSCLIIFEINYLITSTGCSDTNTDYTHVYKFDDGSLNKKIIGSNIYSTYYLLYWYNKKDNNYYLIECCCGKILIYNIFSNELVKELKKGKNESDHYRAIIITEENSNKDYLCSSSDNGFIDIWELEGGLLIKSIGTNSRCKFYEICQWSKRFIIVADSENNSFIIVDFIDGKIIGEIGGVHEDCVIGVKKINHPIYGETLLSNDDEGKINLWVIGDYNIPFFKI